MKIYKQIIAIMNDLEAITKNRQAHTYKFRGIDDVYNALHPLLAEHGVFTVPEVIEDRTEEKATKNGGLSIYRILKIKYHFFADDGSSVLATVIGEGMDSGDKASNKAMAVAHKYALLQVFSIPTEEPKDPEHDHHELVPELYSGKPLQKTQLNKLLASYNIPEVERGHYAKALINVPMTQLEADLKLLIKGKQ